MKYDYDIIILGGGSGGLTASKLARGFGKRVAVIEKNKLGGECTWTGCVPSKRLIAQASVLNSYHKLQKFGITVTGEHSLDTSEVMSSVRQAIQKVYTTHTPQKLEQEGIDVLLGSPEFVDNHTITLNNKTITFDKAVITTGSRPFIPPIDGIESVPYLTNQTVFNLEKLPKSMIILGGGAIGSELAPACHTLGVKVVVVEMADRILLHEDKELVELLMRKMTKDGIELKIGMRAVAVSESNGQVELQIQDKKGNTEKLTAEKLLVATGRRPNVEGLNLEAAGVEVNKKGIVVNKQLRTTARNMYACGDIVGPYLFSHMAWYQATVAVRNACIPFFKTNVSYFNRIWVTFTAPELGTSGLTEVQAKQKYGNIEVYRSYYKDLDRAMIDDTEFGMLKVICKKDGTIVGAHMLGARAGDVIHEIHLARCKRMKLHDIQPVIHAYPTYADLIWQVAKQAYVKRIENNLFVRIVKKFFVKSDKQKAA